MFDFLRTYGSREPSLALQQALLEQGTPSDVSVTSLRVLTRSGSYAGRAVRYFRVFDPRQAAQNNLSVRKFTDLDGRPGLIVGSGHIDQHGVVHLAAREPATATPAPAPTRVPAARAKHADDQHLVFPGANESSQHAP
jgi:hypothetical protein